MDFDKDHVVAEDFQPAPKYRTLKVSPKIVADFLVTVLGFAAANFAVDLDPELSAAIGKVAGFLAAYFSPPGAVVPVGNVEPVYDHQAEVLGE